MNRASNTTQFDLHSATLMITTCFYLTRLIKMPCLQKLPPKPRGSPESAFVADRRRANAPTLSRTKSLIDAALRLWELKQRTR